MKSAVKIFLFLIFITLFSCKKKDENSPIPFAPPSTPTQSARLKSTTLRDTLAGNSFINRERYTYTYNSSGQLTQILKYDSLYDYSTNSILQSSSNEAYHFTYVNSKLEHMMHYVNNVYSDSLAYRFDSQNRIKQVYTYTVNVGVSSLIDSTAYTYLNNEIDLYSAISTNSQDYLFDSNSGIIKVINGTGGTFTITSYVNDQYRNPYYAINFTWKGVASKTNPISRSAGGVLTNYTYLHNSSNDVSGSHYSSSNGSHGYTTYVY